MKRQRSGKTSLDRLAKEWLSLEIVESIDKMELTELTRSQTVLMFVRRHTRINIDLKLSPKQIVAIIVAIITAIGLLVKYGSSIIDAITQLEELL